MEHRFAALESRFTAMESRLSGIESLLSGIEGRLGVTEERMSAMLALIVRIAERLDGEVSDPQARTPPGVASPSYLLTMTGQPQIGQVFDIDRAGSLARSVSSRAISAACSEEPPQWMA